MHLTKVNLYLLYLYHLIYHYHKHKIIMVLLYLYIQLIIFLNKIIKLSIIYVIIIELHLINYFMD
jgi:hypothetical protein